MTRCDCCGKQIVSPDEVWHLDEATKFSYGDLCAECYCLFGDFRRAVMTLTQTIIDGVTQRAVENARAGAESIRRMAEHESTLRSASTAETPGTPVPGGVQPVRPSSEESDEGAPYQPGTAAP